jgi:peptide/nickel transport system permease protein
MSTVAKDDYLAARTVRYRAWAGDRSSDVLPLLGLGFLVVLTILAVFPSLAPHDPAHQDLGKQLVPTFWQSGGTMSHPLGTDDLGRDFLSRVIAGARITLMIGFCAVGAEFAIAVPLGVLAGFRRGLAERVTMRLAEIQLGLPPIILYLFLILIFGQSLGVIILALGLLNWPMVTGMTRVAVKRVSSAPFVEAAAISGSSPIRTAIRHVLPQIRGELAALFFIGVGRVLIAESTLSFLGLGVQPPYITWGLLIGGALDLITVAPWLAITPGLMIIVTVISLNLVAVWSEKWTDPRQRHK